MSKFRNLKKKDFVFKSDIFETYFVYINGGLKAYSYWEWDNGLYTDSGYSESKATWKELKQAVKEKDNYNKNSMWQNNGYCHRCGKKLTAKNYKCEIDGASIATAEWLGQTFFYCNDCKKEDEAEYLEKMEEWANE